MRLYRFKTSNVIAGLLCGLVAMAGCESLRDQTWAQGQGLNLMKIEEFQGKTFLASTGDKRFKGQTSRADELIVLEGFTKINNLDAVQLQFEEGIFAGVELRDLIFYGKENHPYTFEYGFTDHYLVLYKVAPREDIPSQELTYAESTDDKMYKVPVMGVPISLYTVEAVEDERGKDTRKLNEYKKDFLKEATHFRIDLEGIKYFEAAGKQDLLPTDFFNPDDEWFYTKTLVGRPIDSQAILGQTLAALKIKLARTNNSIIGVDLNIAKEQEVLDPTKTITALEFPVEWTDFRLERAGQNAMLLETKLNDQEPTARFWRDRAYALVDFNNADRLDKAFTLDNKLEKLEIGDDYLSFNIYESGTGNTYKYSLVKVNKVQKGQKYFAADAKQFHIFSQKRTVIGGGLFEQTPDIENIVFANRFFPGEKKEIVYHLSDNSPNVPEFNEAVKVAIEAWDQAFQRANTGINVRFDEKRVELGDVRYNQIVLYGYEIDSRLAGGGMLLGFGPSVQDTRSGETFSAAVHIYLRAYREGLIRSIRSFVRNEIGVYDDKVVRSFDDGTSTFDYGTTTKGRSDEMEGTAANIDFLKKNIYAAKAPEHVSRIVNKVINHQGKQELLDKYQQSLQQNALHPTTRKCEYGNVAANAYSWDKIRKICIEGSTKLKKYIADLKTAHQANHSILNLTGEEEAVLDCAQPLMKETLISTLIHEIGHNLGLGHNFAASSDGDNFAKESDGSVAYPSSSVMDYPDRDHDLFSQVGPYDTAVIGYLYGRQVEANDGSVVKIPDDTSAIAAVQKEGKEIKTYRMCTDYEVDGSNLPDFDPLCIKWDVGATPLEYVRWATKKIHADIIEQGYRYNDAAFFGSLGSSGYFSHFRQIHDYFRYLMQKQAGLYFEKITTGINFNESSLIAVMDKTRDPKLTKQYYEAVKEIFEFCRKMLSLPSRVCLVEDSAKQVVEVLEFRDLRNRIFDRHNITVHSCAAAEPYAAEVVTDLNLGIDMTGKKLIDRGIEVDGLELDLDPAAASTKLKQYDFTTYRNGYLFIDANPLYSAGNFDLKLASLRTLFLRQSNVMAVTQGAQVTNISFVDFPWFRDALFSDAVARVSLGINGQDIDERLAGAKRYGHYREYKDFYWLWMISLLDSVGDLRSKAYPYAVSMLPRREISQSSFSQTLAKEVIWWVSIKNKYFLYESDQSLAGQLLKVLVQIGQLPGAMGMKAAIDKDATAEAAKIDLTGVINAPQLIAAVKTYCTSYQVTLQPPQEQALLKLLPQADATTPAEVLTTLRAFLDNPTMMSPLLYQMAGRGDFDNIASLNALITEYVEAIYG